MAHPLDGPCLKVRRAKGQIELLRETEEAFRRDSDYEIVRAEFNPKTGKYAYRVRGNAIPEPEWGVWIGEIAHNLRSALDGLVYQLVCANGKAVTNRTQFPIFVRHFDKKIGKTTIYGFAGQQYGNAGPMIAGVSAKHQAMIERLQPYHRNGRYRTGPNHPLALLREINNADKHRLIQVVGVRPSAVGYSPSAVPHLGRDQAIGRVSFSVLKDGAKVMEAVPEVAVQAKLVPEIAFWQGCEAVRNRPVCRTLWSISALLSEILALFGPEWTDPLQPLPPPAPHELSALGALRAYGPEASIAWMMRPTTP
jgi:hypothetical protein